MSDYSDLARVLHTFSESNVPRLAVLVLPGCGACEAQKKILRDNEMAAPDFKYVLIEHRILKSVAARIASTLPQIAMIMNSAQAFPVLIKMCRGAAASAVGVKPLDDLMRWINEPI